MRYFDAHCHIQFDQFNEDRKDLVTSLQEKGIGGLVVGVDEKSSRAAAEFVQDHPDFYASVGLHPNHAPGQVFDEHMYRNLLMYPNVVAIGECGLDYYRPEDVTDELKRSQKELFERHVHLAGKTKRPLIVHARPSRGSMDAYQDALDIIQSAKAEYGDALKGDLHFFVGDKEVAKRAFELDFTVSYTAVVTFARDYDEVIRYAPLRSLLTETDAPYVAPKERRGQRNDPSSVIEVVRTLAEIRGEDREVVRAATVENAQRLFALGNGA